MDQMNECQISTPEELELKPQTRTRIDPIRTLMMNYLDQTNGKGDFNGCIEYLLEDAEVDQGAEGKILWTSYDGKPKTTKRKSMQNRFNNYKKEWK